MSITICIDVSRTKYRDIEYRYRDIAKKIVIKKEYILMLARYIFNHIVSRNFSFTYSYARTTNKFCN